MNASFRAPVTSAGGTAPVALSTGRETKLPGAAAPEPVSFGPSGFFSSSPTQTPTVISGSNPMNHASVLSSTVPVLPASGQFRLEAAGPGPRRQAPRRAVG